MSANPIDQRIGARLRRVRKELGLSAEDVCKNKKVGINSQPTLSNIESGIRPVKASELARLCELYCKDSWFFLREDEPPDQPFVCAWRNSQDTGDQPMVKAQVHALAQNYQLLQDVTGEKQTSPLEPWSVEVDLTWKSVAEKAQKLVTDWNLGARPAACLHEILEEKLHIKIVSYNLRNAGSALTAKGDFGLVVALNTKEVPWRKNFSLAHELFHLLSMNHFPLNEIHRDETMEPSERPIYERYADTFAATLLMPEKDVIRELEERLFDNNKIEWANLARIAVEFGVSTEAMLWRLKRLGRLTSDRVKQLLTSETFRGIDQFSRAGKKDVGLPYSRRMVWLGVKALRLGKISKGKFCQIFKIARGEFDSFISSYGDLTYDENDRDFPTEIIQLTSRDEPADELAQA